MALSELLTPRIVKIQEMGLNTSRVVLQPLERGFGYTLGTALRRVLLSSIIFGATAKRVIIKTNINKPFRLKFTFTAFPTTLFLSSSLIVFGVWYSFLSQKHSANFFHTIGHSTHFIKTGLSKVFQT